ncbi:hypothetical protein RB653_009352 [Dictyostelium firmibasis]|uniref:Uncharacterized protein n=1 Tax=Dictyostelium firmibasis TaxID=79012 RepID=A0AAN7YXB5_9MYCE
MDSLFTFINNSIIDIDSINNELLSLSTPNHDLFYSYIMHLYENDEKINPSEDQFKSIFNIIEKYDKTQEIFIISKYKGYIHSNYIDEGEIELLLTKIVTETLHNSNLVDNHLTDFYMIHQVVTNNLSLLCNISNKIIRIILNFTEENIQHQSDFRLFHFYLLFTLLSFKDTIGIDGYDCFKEQIIKLFISFFENFISSGEKARLYGCGKIDTIRTFCFEQLNGNQKPECLLINLFIGPSDMIEINLELLISNLKLLFTLIKGGNSLPSTSTSTSTSTSSLSSSYILKTSSAFKQIQSNFKNEIIDECYNYLSSCLSSSHSIIIDKELYLSLITPLIDNNQFNSDLFIPFYCEFTQKSPSLFKSLFSYYSKIDLEITTPILKKLYTEIEKETSFIKQLFSTYQFFTKSPPFTYLRATFKNAKLFIPAIFKYNFNDTRGRSISSKSSSTDNLDILGFYESALNILIINDLLLVPSILDSIFYCIDQFKEKKMFISKNLNVFIYNLEISQINHYLLPHLKAQLSESLVYKKKLQSLGFNDGDYDNKKNLILLPNYLLKDIIITFLKGYNGKVKKWEKLELSKVSKYFFRMVREEMNHSITDSINIGEKVYGLNKSMVFSDWCLIKPSSTKYLKIKYGNNQFRKEPNFNVLSNHFKSIDILYLDAKYLLISKENLIYLIYHPTLNKLIIKLDFKKLVEIYDELQFFLGSNRGSNPNKKTISLILVNPPLPGNQDSDVFESETDRITKLFPLGLTIQGLCYDNHFEHNLPIEPQQYNDLKYLQELRQFLKNSDYHSLEPLKNLSDQFSQNDFHSASVKSLKKVEFHTINPTIQYLSFAKKLRHIKFYFANEQNEILSEKISTLFKVLSNKNLFKSLNRVSITNIFGYSIHSIDWCKIKTYSFNRLSNLKYIDFIRSDGKTENNHGHSDDEDGKDIQPILKKSKLYHEGESSETSHSSNDSDNDNNDDDHNENTDSDYDEDDSKVDNNDSDNDDDHQYEDTDSDDDEDDSKVDNNDPSLIDSILEKIKGHSNYDDDEYGSSDEEN